MPDFTQLPPVYAVIFVIATAVALVVIRSGILEGKNKAPGKAADAGEIVALTIDSRAVDKLAGEVAGLSVVLTEIKGQVQRYINDKEQERADRDLDEEVTRRVTEELDRRERAKRGPVKA